MRKFLLIILSIVILLLVGIAYYFYDFLNTETTALSQRSGDLTFISDRAGNWDIFVLDQQDQLHNLTESSPAHEFFFSYTFDSNHINLFSTATGKVTPAIMNADGSDFRAMEQLEAGMAMMQSGQLDMDAAWSPDGQKLVWLSIRDFNAELYLGNSDTSEAVRLTNNNQTDQQAAWSPDGTRLVFSSERDGGIRHIFLMDVASQDVTQLTEGESAHHQPVWSLDGTQIMFMSERNHPLLDGVFEWVVINADGTGEHILAENEIFKGDATYSPDGTQFAYISNEEGSWHIYVQDVNGTVQRVTDGTANHLYPSWRPVPATLPAAED